MKKLVVVFFLCDETEHDQIVFFFSSRRRHTRWTGDWSSDVCSSDLAFAVARDVMHHFAAAGGVTNMHGVLEVEMRGQRRQIVGVTIHVVAVARLCGATMSAPIMGDDTEALADEEKHLRIPIVC